jgi:predicted amidophosphoribosyltransferase
MSRKGTVTLVIICSTCGKTISRSTSSSDNGGGSETLQDYSTCSKCSKKNPYIEDGLVFGKYQSADSGVDWPLLRKRR